LMSPDSWVVITFNGLGLLVLLLGNPHRSGFAVQETSFYALLLVMLYS